MKKLERFSAGSGRTKVVVEFYEVGTDLLAIIGGEGPHIGAASLAEREPAGGSTRLSTISAAGHREAELTDRFAREVSRATGRRMLAVCGIHLDRIERSEIEAIRSHVGELISMCSSAEVSARLSRASGGS
jgi:hypothetical protein